MACHHLSDDSMDASNRLRRTFFGLQLLIFQENEIFRDPPSNASLMFLCTLCFVLITFISSLHRIGIHKCSGFKEHCACPCVSLTSVHGTSMLLLFRQSVSVRCTRWSSFCQWSHNYLRIIFVVVSRCRPLSSLPTFHDMQKIYFHRLHFLLLCALTKSCT